MSKQRFRRLSWPPLLKINEFGQTDEIAVNVDDKSCLFSIKTYLLSRRRIVWETLDWRCSLLATYLHWPPQTWILSFFHDANCIFFAEFPLLLRRFLVFSEEFDISWDTLTYSQRTLLRSCFTFSRSSISMGVRYFLEKMVKGWRPHF